MNHEPRNCLMCDKLPGDRACSLHDPGSPMTATEVQLRDTMIVVNGRWIMCPQSPPPAEIWAPYFDKALQILQRLKKAPIER